MNDELLTTISALKPDEFASALQSGAPTHYQHIFNAGHSTATQDAKTKLASLTEAGDAARAELASANQELETLRSKQPDIAAWKEEREAALLAKEQAWQAKYDDLYRTTAERTRKAAQERVTNAMVDAGVSRWIAERTIASDGLPLIQVDDELNARFYQPDGKTPLPHGDLDPHDVIAKHLIASMPEALRPRVGQRGSRLGVVESLSSGAVRLTADQARDRATYLAAAEQASKQGVELEIVD